MGGFTALNSSRADHIQPKTSVNDHLGTWISPVAIQWDLGAGFP